MTLSALILAVTVAQAQYGAPASSNEGQVQACVQACIAYIDAPGAELKACVAKCQELGTK